MVTCLFEMWLLTETTLTWPTTRWWDMSRDSSLNLILKPKKVVCPISENHSRIEKDMNVHMD